MSLTSELRSPKSWVNQFFKARVPRIVEFARPRGGAVKAMETVVPSSSAESVRLVGTAFYWSRQGEWMSWRLDELIGESASPAESIDSLREEFRRCAHERAPAFLQRSARAM